MKKHYLKNIFIISIGLFITSCVSPTKMIYLQNKGGLPLKEDLINFEPKIQPGDLLTINVSALDKEAVAPFNLYETTGFGIQKPISYLVNYDGTINFPALGTIKVKDLTNKQITTKIEHLLADYIKNPIVNVRIINFKISVLGEVKNPGSYSVKSERISIFDAIAMAGDLTIVGKRGDVKLIREQNGIRKFVTLDLTDRRIVNSPYYYLAQNDVIYVEPNKTKINTSANSPNTGIIISSISTLISLIAIFVRI